MIKNKKYIPIYFIDYELITFNSSIKCKRIPNKSYIHTYIFNNKKNIYNEFLLRKESMYSYIYSNLFTYKLFPHMILTL